MSTSSHPLADAAAAVFDSAHGESMSLSVLVRQMKASGARGISRAGVERALVRDGRFRREEVLGKPVWHCDPQHVAVVPSPFAAPVSTADPIGAMELRDWQINAFAAWATRGCQGVVEAVTGAGKTRLALAAIRACLAQGGRALVLVPTLELLGQWRRQLAEHVPEATVGQLGGGEADDLFDNHVVIATPHSAAAVPTDLPNGAVGLLVADEAHRYGAPTWAEALDIRFDMRLALTATYERNDDGLVEILGPYFGAVVWEYTFADAATDGVIAPFTINFVGVELATTERANYTLADTRVKEHRRELLSHGLPKSPLELIAAAASLAAQAEGVPNTRAPRKIVAARSYLSALRTRRDVAAQASAKMDVLAALAPQWEQQQTRGLVFTDTMEQAEHAAGVLAKAGIPAEELHGDLPKKKRAIRLAQFRNGNLQMITAPRVLDEGVDVPDAELAVVLASFRTRRQMIQRLGRVLRLKEDGRAAQLVIVFAANTREDPKRGSQDDFLGEVRDVAQSITTTMYTKEDVVNNEKTDHT